MNILKSDAILCLVLHGLAIITCGLLDDEIQKAAFFVASQLWLVGGVILHSIYKSKEEGR